MAGLQRSTTSFRRQGSSGLVWDDKFLSGDLNQMMKRNHTEGAVDSASDGVMRRSRSEGSGRNYRTAKASPPRADPPSPKVSACGFCGFFGRPAPAKKIKPNRRKS